MKLRYTVTVDIDPAEIEPGNPADVVRDEIRSNLESVPYVTACDVVPVTPRSRAENHVRRSGRSR